MSTELSATRSAELAAHQPSALEILQSAVTQGMGIDVIERLAKLQGEMADRDAKKAFAEAFAKFKEQVPAIVKDAAIEVKGTVRSKYAKLDQVAEKVIPVLLDVGITNRWKTRTADDGKIFVTCYLRHVLGHEEEGSTLAHVADNSGSMNALQGLGSTVSYLERYTFVASCGIVIKDQDNDANGNSSNGLSDDKFIPFMDNIKAASNEAELKKFYTAAYLAAENINDWASVQKFKTAKIAKQKEFAA